jgi:hypothetical protein
MLRLAQWNPIEFPVALKGENAHINSEKIARAESAKARHLRSCLSALGKNGHATGRQSFHRCGDM